MSEGEQQCNLIEEKKKEKRGDGVGCDDGEPFPIGNVFSGFPREPQAARPRLVTVLCHRLPNWDLIDTLKWTPEHLDMHASGVQCPGALGRDDQDRRALMP